MGKPKRPGPARLVCALMGSPSAPWGRVREAMVGKFGPVVLESPSYPFTHTKYYELEMGSGLLKFFWAFSGFFPQEALAEAKGFTNALEEELAEDREGVLRRVVNLDPGYLTEAQLVLATTKGYSHRIYLGDGIYAEVTMVYHGGSFEPMGWTYPDYKMPLVLRFMEEVRQGLLMEKRNYGR